MKKTALLTGPNGQDGSYLIELLLSKGYEVHGIIRRSATPNTRNICHLLDRITLHYGDVLDYSSLTRAIEIAQPDEFYNLAAQSFVGSSWDKPEYSANVTGLGALRCLEALRQVSPYTRYYQASSSEMFGDCGVEPQNEQTPFHPRSPYGVAKVFGHYITQNYRESFDMFACSGILFNHESPRRGDEFVTQKIVRAAVAIKRGEQHELWLGNLDARRDWGYAGDYVQAMWLMLQQDEPDDYVVGTGEAHSVAEFCDAAFDRVNLDWRDYVEVDPDLYRPADVALLRADATKAHNKLGWYPRWGFKDLVNMMVIGARAR